MIDKAVFMALGMFTILPTRKGSWHPDAAPLISPILPFIGAFIGLVWYFVAVWAVKLPIALCSAAIALTPIILTGLLHIDGFIDTADAVLSRRSLEERRGILKDPAVGAFGVVSVICLHMLQFCAVYSIAAAGKDFIPLVYITIMSRCVAGFSILTLKPLSLTGYMHTFKNGAKPRHVAMIVVTAMLFLVLAFATGGPIALVEPVAVLAGSACVSAYLYRQMKGFSGDLCGCAIVVGELCGLLAMAII
jgi:adenosylcobinamide-GDP ribazoletransferase